MPQLKKSTLSALTFLLVLLIIGCNPHVNVRASKGPRTEDLTMYFYSDVLATYNALERGEIDVMGFDVYESIYLDAIANPNVVLAPVDDMGMYEFDINNNYTIPSYPGVRSPTNYKEFRQTLAFLVDKDRVVEEFCDGFAARIDQPIVAPTHGWMNKSYTGANYPYEYDPAAASALLDSTGFINGTTPNPYYDPVFPGSTTTLRTYPPGHSKAGQDMDEVIFYVRADDLRRFQAGRHLYQNARKIGIPVEANEGPSSYTYDSVMGMRDYHVYTGCWGVGKFPTYLYWMFHSNFNVAYGHNYVVGFEADGSANHPPLDKWLYKIISADTFEEAFTATQNALGLITELCIIIPLFSPRSYWAYSTELLGTVSMDSYVFDQDFFFLNAYKVDGSPIRWGVISPPEQLNIVYSDWIFDFQCLRRVYDYANFDLPPYNIVFDQPGWVLDWTVELWDDAGTSKSKITKKFRPDNYFVDPAGNQLENVDADSYLFSNYVAYATSLGDWCWCGNFEDTKFFNKLNNYEVEIFFNARSYWLYTDASPPLLPMSVWLNTSYGLTQKIITTYVVDTNLTTPGFLGIGPNLFSGPVWINSIVSDLDGSLTEWVDFHWELGDWHIDTALTSGAVVTVDYYAMDDASGFTLGDNPWEDVTVGCGMYYATGFTPGVGGNFTARRNPYYYLETPVLGEVDFVWEEGGYYEVTIFDIVMAAGAYGSQGIAVPDDNWFPGADIVTPGGAIDIFDIVTIAGKYGQTFGTPPP